MSFDITFVADPMPPVEDLRAWFAARPDWHRPDADADMVRFEDPRTGAYLDLDFAEPIDAEEEEPGIVATLPTGRPTPYIDAALPELAAFVAAFPMLRVEAEDGAIADWDAAAIRAGWLADNAAATRRLITPLAGDYGSADRLARMPGDRLAAIWEWNRATLAELRATHGPEVCVPPIRFANVEGDLLTLAIIADNQPALLPPPDLLDRVAHAPAQTVTDDRTILRGLTAWIPREVIHFDKTLPGPLAGLAASYPMPADDPQPIHPMDVWDDEALGDTAG